jgi:hypothetical protein
MIEIIKELRAAVLDISGLAALFFIPLFFWWLFS